MIWNHTKSKNYSKLYGCATKTFEEIIPHRRNIDIYNMYDIQIYIYSNKIQSLKL